MANTKVTLGFGNMTADVDFSDEGERQAKMRLAMELNAAIRARKLKQVAIADLLGIPQPKVSSLMNYRLDGFSVERLMEFFTALNHDVEIVIRPRESGRGHISVVKMR